MFTFLRPFSHLDLLRSSCWYVTFLVTQTFSPHGQVACCYNWKDSNYLEWFQDHSVENLVENTPLKLAGNREEAKYEQRE